MLHRIQNNQITFTGPRIPNEIDGNIYKNAQRDLTPQQIAELGFVDGIQQQPVLTDSRHITGWTPELQQDGTVLEVPTIETLPIPEQVARIKAKAREKAGNLIGQEEQVSMLWEGMGILFNLLKENFAGKAFAQAKATLSTREQKSLDDMTALQPARKAIYDHAATLIAAAQAGQPWTLADGTWPGDS